MFELNKRVKIPYYLIEEIKSKLEDKYKVSLLNKNKIDSYIFVNKKVVNILVKYVYHYLIYDSARDFNYNDFLLINDNKIFFDNESIYLHGFVEKDEFIIINITKNNEKYIFFKFCNNLRYAQVFYIINTKDLISEFQIDCSNDNFKLYISKIEEKLKL